ncbi:MAG: ABC transporter permease [Pseudonocardiales bacterium]|nr:MAG: ABC transporter permease [Pseudonocardiales bacterium]
MLTLTWLRGLLSRRGGRLGAAAVGVAVAVALLASLGSFLASAKASMTAQSIQRVAVDWQIQTQPGANPDTVLATMAADPRVARALPVGYATVTGLSATSGGSTQTTGSGVVLGLGPQYPATFPDELRYLTGAHHGVLLAQQTAANLHAGPGTPITIHPGGALAPMTVTVAGIVDLPQANSLFQKVGAAPGAQPLAPPDNVVLLPHAQWHTLFDPLAATHPDLVTTQIHTRNTHQLPSDPAAAYTVVTGAAHHLEATLAGTGLVGDNLGAALDAARSDALYAQVLFLFLGLPGAILAGLLTAMIAATGASRRRGEQALLRARGATPTQLLRLATVEATLTGLVGGVVGIGLAALVGAGAFGSPSFGAGTPTALGYSLGAVTAGLVIALISVAGPVARDLRATTVVAARAAVGRPAAPGWLRYGLDLWLIAISLVVFWLTSRNGYTLVFAPEGVPTISVSYWALAAPALLWIGAGLLAWRLTYLLLGPGRPLITRAMRPVAHGLASTVAATLSRQRTQLARTVAIIALTAAFAISVATFDATYRHQALADAVLTNGAAVTVTEPVTANVPPATAAQIATVAGVSSVEPLQHRFAYVGANLQDLYGIQPATILNTTLLQNSYFTGGTAAQLIHRLAAQPDAILVSQETVTDYQLHPGDLIRLRLIDTRSGHTTTVPFHYVGIVAEFPTAPKDSFLVANASYIATQTGSTAIGTFLITTNGTPPPVVAARVQALLGPSAHVTNITTTRNIVGSSLTAVDLSGLTTVELGFALALAAAATGLLLALGFTERRRTFALARALGAHTRQLGALVWGEVLIVGVTGAALGTLIGWALTEMLVKVLTGVFDPPPQYLTVPWTYLGALAALAALCLSLAALRTITVARRPALHVLRDL